MNLSHFFKTISVLSILALPLHDSVADRICLKIAGSKITRKTVNSKKKCAKGFTEIVDTAKLTGPIGPTGATGPTGAAGLNGSSTSDFVWGTGADGDITLSGATTLDALKQYRNITIDSSAVVTVSTGSSIRCSGNLTIAGQVNVTAGGIGGKIETDVDGATLDSVTRAPSAYLGFSPAPAGEVVITNPGAGISGAGGVSQTASSDVDALKNTFKVGAIFGGGGAGSLAGEGGAGGGSIALLCKGGVTISPSGIISAEGSAGGSGAGGGAGGLVLVATNGTLTNQGVIRARGGSGGSFASTTAPGGGGAGGIINLLAASIQNTGTFTVTGGAGGASGTVSGVYRSGGGAGGSLGGLGGNGGNVVNNTNSSTVGTNGSSGQVFQTTVTGADVAALLL